MSHSPRIAIIGAGLAGAHLACRMQQRAEVVVFEKSRGLGGRMSTRRAGDFQFDHGAQYFTAHGQAFRSFLAPFIAAGQVARWTPRLVALGGADPSASRWTEPRYVAVPGMTGLVKAMADGLDLRRATRIAGISPAGAQWRLSSEVGEDCGLFDWVISTAPAEQSARLMPDVFAQKQDLGAARMQGCYSLMIGLDHAVDLPWDAATVENSPLAWISCNQTKPGRSGATSIVCQSGNIWAEAHLEDDQDAVRDILVSAFESVTGVPAAEAAYLGLHRWRFANVETPASQPFLIDPERRLAAAGDWCGHGRVEAAFDSAEALGDALEDFLVPAQV